MPRVDTFPEYGRIWAESRALVADLYPPWPARLGTCKVFASIAFTRRLISLRLLRLLSKSPTKPHRAEKHKKKNDGHREAKSLSLASVAAAGSGAMPETLPTNCLQSHKWPKEERAQSAPTSLIQLNACILDHLIRSARLGHSLWEGWTSKNTTRAYAATRAFQPSSAGCGCKKKSPLTKAKQNILQGMPDACRSLCVIISQKTLAQCQAIAID